ncbi:hypothetical protein BBJ28_00025123, partial [Nothophytophthora sp. Chile5]
MASPPPTSSSDVPNSSASPPLDPSPSVASASTSDAPANFSVAGAPRGVLTLLGSMPFTPYAPWIDEVELPARGGPPPNRCPSCIRGASVDAAVIALPALDPGILQAAVSSIQNVLAHGEDLRRVQADYLSLQNDHSALLQHAGGLHRQLRSAGRLIHPFASFVHDKVDGLCQELGSAKILAAEYVSHNEKLQTELTEMEDLRADYDALERQAAEQEGKQATRIRELELQLNTAQVNPPSNPSRDLQLLALASAKDAALTEVSGQRRRIEILEAGQQTLKDRLERERADRAFEADRLQTKIRKFRKQRNQLRDQQTKARADLAAAMGARSRALSDAAELRKSRAQRENSALRRERDAAKVDCDQAQQRLATVASALGHAPSSSVPPKRPRLTSTTGGSADPEAARPRKSRRIAATLKEESKTEEDGVTIGVNSGPKRNAGGEQDARTASETKCAASDKREASVPSDPTAIADDDQEGDADRDLERDADDEEDEDGSDDDVIRAALTRSRSDVRRSSIEEPGSAESPIHLEGSGGSSDASEREWTPGSNDTSPPPTGVVPQGPVVFTCIPGFDRPRVFRVGEITPWIPSEINDLSISGLTVDILSKRRLHRPGFHFGVRRKTPPASEYKASLITGSIVADLLAAEPWEVLNVNVPSLTFDPSLSMGDLAEAYSRFEDSYRQAYWESTHYLQITGAMRQTDPALDAYCGERKQRRSHAGGRWKKILAMTLRLMGERHCDLDLLLDPFFLQFPALGESGFWYPGIEDGADPATLLDALAISDAADPWRNHHRDAM